MANTIRIKRRSSSGAAGAPTVLAPAELAYNENDNTLYYGYGDGGSGDASSVISVAGSGAFMTTGTTQSISAAKTFSNITITGGSVSGITDLAVEDGGTGSSSASGARLNLGAAASGANSDITSITGLTTALSVAQGGTGATTASGARANLLPTYASNAGKVIAVNSGGTDVEYITPNPGTVTSISMTVPDVLSVSGSPITSSGTLAVTLATQSANTVFAGPSSGSSSTPAFRGLVAADIPDISSTYLATAGGTVSSLTVSNNLIVSGNLTVSGSVTTVSSTTITVADKNIELATGATTDAAADGGGITLKGASDKEFKWIDSTDSWTSSEHLDLANGKVLKIGGNTVLSATTLYNVVIDGGTF